MLLASLASLTELHLDDRLKDALTRSTVEINCPTALLSLAAWWAREIIVAEIRAKHLGRPVRSPPRAMSISATAPS